MKYFIKKLLLFIIPLSLYLPLVVIVDPYNYFNISNGIESNLKQRISYKLNYPLWKLLRFQESPAANILLGDSRTAGINIDLLKEHTKDNFFNLAYGGASLQEIILTFWEADKKASLKSVYIGVNFDLYNKFNDQNRVSEAISIKNNFFSYVLSHYTSRSLFLILKEKLLNVEVNIGKPSMSKEEFWQKQLTSGVAGIYEMYKYPSDYFDELKKISDYCKKKKIKLIFFIPPTHTDLQKKISDYSLLKYEEQFKNDLRSLGVVYDFDYPSEITTNKQNFSDPFHCKNEISKIIVNEIFTNKPHYSKCQQEVKHTTN